MRNPLLQHLHLLLHASAAAAATAAAGSDLALTGVAAISFPSEMESFQVVPLCMSGTTPGGNAWGTAITPLLCSSSSAVRCRVGG